MKRSRRSIPFCRPADVIEYARDEVVAHPDKLRILSDVSGVSLAWLRAFRHGRLMDPGFSKIARLLPHLGIRIEYRNGKHFATLPARPRVPRS
jgi:hypothetical protein